MPTLKSDLKNTADGNKLTCPICSSPFLNIFPAGKCRTCARLVCGHCVHHDSPGHTDSICQDCIEKLTPRGRVAQMEANELLTVLQDPSSKDSPWVAQLLGDRKNPSALEPLCQALKSNRIDVRREAAKALGKMESDRAVPWLLTALKDSSSAVRSRATYSLAELDAQNAVTPLKKQLDDPSRQAAGYAVQALGKLMGNKACDLLRDLVYDHASSFVRCEALAVLAGLNHELALAAALRCLNDPKKEVIISACKILIKLNDLEAAPRLQELIEKKPPASVRITATATLNTLLGAKN
ncbi:MAG: HEAT repeat domain-containing protein [Desulfobacula sp.]|nr:HEAT repeat domain-containing protein [Desulfobacula sp.]